MLFTIFTSNQRLIRTKQTKEHFLHSKI